MRNEHVGRRQLQIGIELTVCPDVETGSGQMLNGILGAVDGVFGELDALSLEDGTHYLQIEQFNAEIFEHVCDLLGVEFAHQGLATSGALKWIHLEMWIGEVLPDRSRSICVLTCRL